MDDLQARTAYLDSACRRDSELRQKVERLLAADHRAGDLPPESSSSPSIASHLPDIDSLTLVSRLREMGNSMPALLVASTQDDGLARRALEKGFAGVIHKPLLNEHLLRQLALLLQPTPPGLIDLRP